MEHLTISEMTKEVGDLMKVNGAGFRVLKSDFTFHSPELPMHNLTLHVGIYSKERSLPVSKRHIATHSKVD